MDNINYDGSEYEFIGIENKLIYKYRKIKTGFTKETKGFLKLNEKLIPLEFFHTYEKEVKLDSHNIVHNCLIANVLLSNVINYFYSISRSSMNELDFIKQQTLSIRLNEINYLLIECFSQIPRYFEPLKWTRKVSLKLVTINRKTKDISTDGMIQTEIIFKDLEDYKCLMLDEESINFIKNILPLYLSPINSFLNNTISIEDLENEFISTEYSNALKQAFKIYIKESFEPLYENDKYKLYYNSNSIVPNFIINNTIELSDIDKVIAERKGRIIFKYLSKISNINPYTGEVLKGKLIYKEQDAIIIDKSGMLFLYKKIDDIYITLINTDKDFNGLMERYEVLKKLQ